MEVIQTVKKTPILLNLPSHLKVSRAKSNAEKQQNRVKKIMTQIVLVKINFSKKIKTKKKAKAECELII
jgi:hypothetical protein